MGGLFTEPGLKPTILQSASQNLLVNLPASRNPRFVQMLHTCRGRPAGERSVPRLRQSQRNRDPFVARAGNTGALAGTRLVWARQVNPSLPSPGHHRHVSGHLPSRTENIKLPDVFSPPPSRSPTQTPSSGPLLGPILIRQLNEHATAGAAMSRNFYDIDPAGEVLCTYTDDGSEKERQVRSVSVVMAATTNRQMLLPAPSSPIRFVDQTHPLFRRRKPKSPSRKPCSTPSSPPATRTP